MKTLRYEIVDVFTDRPFAGNPLAVVLDAGELASGEMQAIAREFNLSETVFVVPTTSARADYRVRIFTPGRELPFAGHPSVGVAVTLARLWAIKPGEVVQECLAGLMPVHVTEHTARLTGGTPTIGPELDPAPLLETAGLTAADHTGTAPRVAGCGLEFPFLPVRPEALDRALPDATAARRHGIDQVSVFAWDAATATAHARVFLPGAGVPEDPATGSAALGLGVWLVGAGLLPGDGVWAYTIRQGVQMHRPSTLTCTVTSSGGAATTATVSGGVAPVAHGELTVPPFIG